MSGYFGFKDGEKLSNRVIDISQSDIHKMLKINSEDKRLCEAITESSYAGDSFYSGDPNKWIEEFYEEVLVRDRKTAGYITSYPHGTVIRQAERNHYYRGENQIYQKSIPSLLRSLEGKSQQDRNLYVLVADMRIAEFAYLIWKFAHVQNWPYGDVLLEMLAQHYGFETNWLDITNDLEVALFFATCIYNHKEKCWQPLTKNIIESSEKYQYGMIFHTPSWQVHTNPLLTGKPMFDEELEVNATPTNRILPIGFQPFMRCHMQYGYGIEMRDKYPLQQDSTFEKLRFRQTESLSRMIFGRMQGGFMVYPHEGLNELEDIIAEIKTTSHFSEFAFDHAFKKSANFKDKELCRQQLLNSNVLGDKRIVISNESIFRVSRQRRRKIDRLYAEFSIEEKYGIKPVTRLVRKPI